MRRILLSLTVLLMVGACSTPGPAVIPIADQTHRVWLGPDFYANRLQDWRLEGGIIKAVEGRSVKPMRTAHLLTSVLTSGAGEFRASVLIHGAAVSGSADDWGGFLIGAGSESIDHRISVLTHHWPADQGGVVAAIDGAGRLVVRDNARSSGRSGPGARYNTGDWPLLGIADSVAAVLDGPVRLTVSGYADDDGNRLVMALDSPSTGVRLAEGTVEGLPDHAMDGTVALVSHGSPAADDLGYGFSDLTVSGSRLEPTPERAVGPVVGMMFTQSRGILKLTAQFLPLGDSDAKTAVLQRRSGSRWEDLAEAPVDANGYTATFRVEDWDSDAATDVRVSYDLRVGPGATEARHYEGHVPAEPVGDEFVLAGLNCHHISGGDGSWTHRHFWYPHAELARLVESRDPDMLYFAGDQIYESGLEGVVRSPTDTAILDYLNHWNRFLLAFGDLTRRVPTVATPDDHDVYHGNIWGAGGKAATGPHTPASDNGGYMMAPGFVNAVHRTQTSHLPDPVDPAPILGDISVWYTDLLYGGVSFAVLSDRMWKSAPRDLLPEARIWNGWSQDLTYDAAAGSDAPGADLLGSRQEEFLEEWADDWSGGAWMKVVLSQTPFVNVATIPEDALNGSVIPGLPNPGPGEYLEGYRKAADHDSGGWPQTPRDRAIRLMRRAGAVHIAGDQHLGSVVRYGVEAFGDAGYAFTVPSIANIWPRRWFPPEEGANRSSDRPRYTGDFYDGFGNRMTVMAVANPVDSGVEPTALYDRTPGFGIVRFRQTSRDVTFEAWPRWTDPSDPAAPQYADWPIDFNQLDGFGGPWPATLDPVFLEGTPHPVVRVDDETTGEWLYTLRAPGDAFAPWVPDPGHSYRVRVSDPDQGVQVVLEGRRVAQ